MKWSCVLRRAIFFLLVRSTYAGSAAEQAILPPELPWNGKSKELIVPADDPWATPFEQRGLNFSPRYAGTVAWCKKLDDASPELQMISLGRSPEGRDLIALLASSDRNFTPQIFSDGRRPVVLIQACIHPGENDGKDAGMMLLRDLTARGTKRDLLRGVNIIFVPIYNVDGHERISPFGRINQRGPSETGWRTTARNLNLNRDYAKLDAPETRAMLSAINKWKPDLYLDLHVTDGADYQYDITWDFPSRAQYSPAISAWLEETLEPALRQDLIAMGHTPTRYVNFIDNLDPGKGLSGGPDMARFSTGYGDARHLPTILVETHSLKPFAQRVIGTYVLLASILRTMNASGTGLKQAIASDAGRSEPEFATRFTISKEEPPVVEFLGVESRLVPSPISGGLNVEWLGKPATLRIPGRRAVVVEQRVKRPQAYWIPPQWPEIIERLRLHGINFETMSEAREVDVEMYRLENAKVSDKPFEGHTIVTAQPKAEQRKETFPAGSIRVPVRQPLGDLACVLLEPAGPDSFFSWGLMLETLQQIEYVEGYVMEPMAARMLAENPKLAEEFRQKLQSDEAFRTNARERLHWFYQRTPFYDDRYLLYPIAREM